MHHPPSVLSALLVIVSATSGYAGLLPYGVLNDDQISVVYTPDTGGMAIEGLPNDKFSVVVIQSAAGLFRSSEPFPTGDCRASGEWCLQKYSPHIQLLTHFQGRCGFIGYNDGYNLGGAQKGLAEDTVLNDLTAFGMIGTGGMLGPVDLAYDELIPGDANRDLAFNPFDLVQVLHAGKYLTGQTASWGEGDWNGAPGGSRGNPPAGDGLFNQLDIVAAQQGAAYLGGRYEALAGTTIIAVGLSDEQTSLLYNPATGELSRNAPVVTNLTSINIDSAAAVFAGDPADNHGGRFDNDADDIFKATFGSSFGSLTLSNVAQAGLLENFVANDLTVIGSLAGGGDLGAVDLVYIPEPSTMALLALGLAGALAMRRRRRP